MDVYALVRNGFSGDLVGEGYYEGRFSDSRGRGIPPGEMLELFEQAETVYVGGGRLTDCVPRSMRSFAKSQGRTREEMSVVEEIGFEYIDSYGPTSLDEMREIEEVSVEDYLSSIGMLAQVESLF